MSASAGAPGRRGGACISVLQRGRWGTSHCIRPPSGGRQGNCRCRNSRGQDPRPFAVAEELASEVASAWVRRTASSRLHPRREDWGKRCLRRTAVRRDNDVRRFSFGPSRVALRRTNA